MANVLIVDDDFDIAEGLSLCLQQAGHLVRTAGTGEDGLRVLRAAALPDCILLDVDMPVVSGPEMAHRMLVHDAGEEFVPIVLLSGSANLPAIAGRMGTPYFLGKPADSQVLLQLLDRAMHERIPPSSGGMKVEQKGGDRAAGRASDSSHRDVTDESLRSERKAADTARAGQQAAVETEADGVVRRARRVADAVLLDAREQAAHERTRHPATKEALAETGRAGRAADVITRTERATADEALREERSESRRVLHEFLEAERTLTDSSLEDERVHTDVTVGSRDEFLGMVSHDLRSLLGGVGLNVSMLARGAAPGEAGDATRKRTADIQRVLGRMNRLFGDLLDIASIEAGQLRIVREAADACQVVAEAMAGFVEIAQRKDITLDFDCASAEVVVARFDRERIMQVVANLLSNALKFTQAKGRVVVRVERAENEVRVSVADNGPGISADLLTVVFERYRQIRADRRGLGLGLFISKSIVEAHGGRLWVESQLGDGSTFRFTLARDLQSPRTALDASPPAQA